MFQNYFKMDGLKTKALVASGLSVADKDGSYVTEQSGFSGDAIVSGLTDGLSKHFALQLENPFLQTVAYNSTKYLFLEVAQYMFDGLGGFTAGNTLGFSITQLKEMLKDVLHKLDIILDEPAESSSIFMEKALDSIEHGFCKDAHDHFKEVVKKAIQGLSYATKKVKPEGMISVTRLMIIAEISIATYNRQEERFETWEKLSESQRDMIYSSIRSNLDRLINSLKTLKKKGLFSRQKTFDAENQDVLDNLLRQMLPILLQFQSNKAKTTKAEGSDKTHQIVISSLYIPEGIEDAVCIGEKDNTVAIWKNMLELYVFYNGITFSGDISDDTDEIVIAVDTAKANVSVNGNMMKQNTMKEILTDKDMKNMVKKNNVNILAMMLKFGHINGEDCLEMACRYGSVGCVDAMLQNMKIDINSRLGYGYQGTPLACAAANGHPEVVKHLIRNYQADVDRKGYHGYSALSYAIAYSHLDTVKMLLKMGADIKDVTSVTMMDKNVRSIGKVGNAEKDEMENYIKNKGINLTN